MSSVPCPHCKASAMNPCVAVGTDKPLKYSSMHPSRLALLGEQPDYAAVGRKRKADDEFEK